MTTPTTPSRAQRDRLAGQVYSACVILQEVKRELTTLPRKSTFYVKSPSSQFFPERDIKDALGEAVGACGSVRSLLRAINYIVWEGNKDTLDETPEPSSEPGGDAD